MAWPSRGVLKLWRDACERLEIDADRLRALPGERDKYLLPVAAHTEPVRLGYLFLLQRGAGGGAVPVEGAARLAALQANSYKPNYLSGLGCVESHFRISCQIAAQVEMAELRWQGLVGEGADLLTSNCRCTLSRNKVLGSESSG
jgi:hypothetical protein